MLSRPEHIREVFAGSAETFHAGEGNAMLGPIMGEHSVLLLDEDAHKAARKRVMSAFHGETIASWAPAIEQHRRLTTSRAGRSGRRSRCIRA